MSMLGKIDKTTWVVSIGDNDKINGFIGDGTMMMIMVMVLMMMTVATILLIKVKIAVMVYSSEWR